MISANASVDLVFPIGQRDRTQGFLTAPIVLV